MASRDWPPQRGTPPGAAVITRGVQPIGTAIEADPATDPVFLRLLAHQSLRLDCGWRPRWHPRWHQDLRNTPTIAALALQPQARLRATLCAIAADAGVARPALAALDRAIIVSQQLQRVAADEERKANGAAAAAAAVVRGLMLSAETRHAKASRQIAFALDQFALGRGPAWPAEHVNWLFVVGALAAMPRAAQLSVVDAMQREARVPPAQLEALCVAADVWHSTANGDHGAVLARLRSWCRKKNKKKKKKKVTTSLPGWAVSTAQWPALILGLSRLPAGEWRRVTARMAQKAGVTRVSLAPLDWAVAATLWHL